MVKFKPGDSIECVDVKGGSGQWLQLGAIYTFQEYDSEERLVLVEGIDNHGGFHSYRFKLSKESKVQRLLNQIDAI